MFRILSAAAIALVFLISCKGGKDIEGKIVIYTPYGTPSIPIVKSIETSTNITPRIYNDIQGEVIPDILKSNNALYVLPANTGAVLYNKGIDIAVLAVITTGMIRIVTRSADVRSIKDLNDSEIYIPAKGSSPDVISRILFSSLGIKPKIQYSSSPEILKLFEAKEIKTAVLPEPYASILLFRTRNLESREISDLRSEWINLGYSTSGFPQTAIFTSRKLYREKHVIIDAFIADFEKSVEWTNSNPDKAALLGVKKINIDSPPEILSSSIPNMNLTAIKGSEAYTILKSYYETINRFDPAAIGKKVPDENIVIH